MEEWIRCLFQHVWDDSVLVWTMPLLSMAESKTYATVWQVGVWVTSSSDPPPPHHHHLLCSLISFCAFLLGLYVLRLLLFIETVGILHVCVFARSASRRDQRPVHPVALLPGRIWALWGWAGLLHLHLPSWMEGHSLWWGWERSLTGLSCFCARVVGDPQIAPVWEQKHGLCGRELRGSKNTSRLWVLKDRIGKQCCTTTVYPQRYKNIPQDQFCTLNETTFTYS